MTVCRDCGCEDPLNFQGLCEGCDEFLRDIAEPSCIACGNSVAPLDELGVCSVCDDAVRKDIEAQLLIEEQDVNVDVDAFGVCVWTRLGESPVGEDLPF